MKSNELVITIYGCVSSGKTTVAEKIADVLRLAGIDVNIEDEDLDGLISLPFKRQRLDALASKRTKVKIKTIQLCSEIDSQ